MSNEVDGGLGVDLNLGCEVVTIIFGELFLLGDEVSWNAKRFVGLELLLLFPVALLEESAIEIRLKAPF